jgi:RHS repeat-associated protein
MPAHVGAGVPANINKHRGLSARGYDFAEAERVKYDAYGKQTVLADNGVVAYKPSDYGQFVGFTGRYHDYETGLQYFRARYFDNTLGRFIGRDPAGYVDGLGLYGAYFVPNDVDPSGEKVLSFLIAQLGKKVSKEAVKKAIKEFVENKVKKELTDLKDLADDSLKDAAKKLIDKADSVLDAFDTATGAWSWTDYIPLTGDFACGERISTASIEAFSDLDSLTDEWESLLRKKQGKGKKTGPKQDLDSPHNKKIKDTADDLVKDGNTIRAGGGSKPEQLVPTPGGNKDGRRPDIIYETPSGDLGGVNVGRTKADGTPVTREVNALNDLNGPGGLPTTFVPYR